MENIGFFLLGTIVTITTIFLIVYIKYKKLLKYEYLNSLDLNDPDDFEEAAIHVYGPIVKKYEDVTLFLLKVHGKEKMMIWDTSAHQEKNIIGLTVVDPKCTLEDINYTFVPHQTISLHEKGECTWRKT